MLEDNYSEIDKEFQTDVGKKESEDDYSDEEFEEVELKVSPDKLLESNKSNLNLNKNVSEQYSDLQSSPQQRMTQRNKSYFETGAAADEVSNTNLEEALENQEMTNLKKKLSNVDELNTNSDKVVAVEEVDSTASPPRAQENYQMLTSGGMNSDENRQTVPRLKLNLNIGNITGIPSALGLTDGGETTKYKFKGPKNEEQPQKTQSSVQYGELISPKINDTMDENQSVPHSRLHNVFNQEDGGSGGFIKRLEDGIEYSHNIIQVNNSNHTQYLQKKDSKDAPFYKDQVSIQGIQHSNLGSQNEIDHVSIPNLLMQVQSNVSPQGSPIQQKSQIKEEQKSPKSKKIMRHQPKSNFKIKQGLKKKIELETIISGIQGQVETPFSHIHQIRNTISPLAKSRQSNMRSILRPTPTGSTSPEAKTSKGRNKSVNRRDIFDESLTINIRTLDYSESVQRSKSNQRSINRSIFRVDGSIHGLDKTPEVVYAMSNKATLKYSKQNTQSYSKQNTQNSHIEYESGQPRYQSMYVRVQHSDSVERMLKENQEIKDQFLEHVEGLYVKLENQIEKKRKHLKEVKNEYELEQRRREFRSKQIQNLKIMLKKEIQEMQFQIDKVYNGTLIQQEENKLMEKFTEYNKLRQENELAENYGYKVDKAQSKDIGEISMQIQQENYINQECRGLQSQISWEKKVIERNERIMRYQHQQIEEEQENLKNLAKQVKEKKEILKKDPDFDKKQEITPEKMVKLQMAVYFEEQECKGLSQQRNDLEEDYKAEIDDYIQKNNQICQEINAMAPNDNRANHELRKAFSSQKQILKFLQDYKNNKQNAIQEQQIFQERFVIDQHGKRRKITVKPSPKATTPQKFESKQIQNAMQIPESLIQKLKRNLEKNPEKLQVIQEDKSESQQDSINESVLEETVSVVQFGTGTSSPKMSKYLSDPFANYEEEQSDVNFFNLTNVEEPKKPLPEKVQSQKKEDDAQLAALKEIQAQLISKIASLKRKKSTALSTIQEVENEVAKVNFNKVNSLDINNPDLQENSNLSRNTDYIRTPSAKSNKTDTTVKISEDKVIYKNQAHDNLKKTQTKLM